MFNCYFQIRMLRFVNYVAVPRILGYTESITSFYVSECNQNVSTGKDKEGDREGGKKGGKEGMEGRNGKEERAKREEGEKGRDERGRKE